MAEPEPEPVAAAAAAVVGVGENLLYVAKKWKVVGTWKWNFATDTCAICRNSLYEPSLEVQALAGEVEHSHPGLMFARGSCTHVFHLDCVQRWLRTRNVCPLCNKEWELRATERIGIPSSSAGS